MPLFSPTMFQPRARRMQSQYPQNQGLADGVAELEALNLSFRNQQPAPYRPTGTPATGNRNYGGQFGNPGAAPLDFERPQRGPYTPLNQPAIPVASQVASSGEYDQQMAAHNPNGRWYGGALPAMIISSGGQVRPGFMSRPPGQGGTPESIAAANQGLVNKGYQQDSRGSWFRSPGAEPQGQTQAMAAAVNMLHSPQRQQYLDDREEEMDFRRGNVMRNAQERSAARRHRMGEGNPVDMFFRQNPLAGLQYGMAQQRFGLQQQELAQQGQLGWGKLGVESEGNRLKGREAQDQITAAFIGALPQLIQGGIISPEQGEQAMQQFGGQMFGGAQQGQASGGASRGTAASPFADNGNQVYLGGLLTAAQKRQLDRAKDDPNTAADLLSSFGLTDEQVNLALNRQYNANTWFPWTRSRTNPTGSWWTADGFINPQTGASGWNPIRQFQQY